jgi:hypothetical protein
MKNGGYQISSSKARDTFFIKFEMKDLFKICYAYLISGPL